MAKRSFLVVAISLISLSKFVFSASSVTRDLPEGYVAGTTFQVTLTVIPDQVYSIIVREYLPEGWTIVSSTPAYSTYIAEDNMYKWLNYSSNPLQAPYFITYTVSVPPEAAGNKIFFGTFVDDFGTLSVGGDTVIVDNSTVATPQFTPPAGTYTTSQSVSISCTTEGASIRYTTDGSDPTESSPLYTQAIIVSVSTTIKARAFKEGLNPSQIATAMYTILETVAAPSFSPLAGAYSSPQNVTISCATSDATIRYTTDGSEPNEGSPIYSTPIPVNSEITLKARAFKEGMNPSSVTIGRYLFPFGLITPTNTWANFYGTATINNVDVQPGDMIAAFDPQGVVCGSWKVTNAGFYGFMAVYGDDATTPGVDEGAVNNDTITFKIWSAAEDRIYMAATLGPGSPIWQSDTNINVNLNGVNRWRMNLNTGWNLISFPLGTCYYDSASPPAVAMLPDITYVKVNSISEVLTSIAGKYVMVRGFDAGGATTYDPSVNPVFNTLHYLAPGYGYWIKMSEPATLELEGLPVTCSATLTLNAGWNLVGYWHTSVFYDTANQPAVSFPEGVTDFVKLPSIANALSSITGP
ncbi:MAG: chitobiase/beta-hexosaminidase C-terminal domain-containing protein, partial [Candidatus Omnitrophica bacterium]|nr:chitobiase/beta-hexosaminidase C-terminal domain-containing protein [Candidatus Omnitrophota bacterium]